MRRERIENLAVKSYIENGQIPWSPGYLVYRQRFISEVLANPDLMSKFHKNEHLPPDYGFAVDERCVEYPWLIAQLDAQPERILDAGSALNHQFLLDQHILRSKKIHILTLAPEQFCYCERGISYLFEDLREIPISDNYYDKVICVSTLEHVGFDNRRFAGLAIQKENRPYDFVSAVREMRRVLKPSGHLMFTVPFGRYKELGTQQVFDDRMLGQAIAAFEPSEVASTFFIYTKEGWQFADIGDCRECEYVDWIMLTTRARPTKFPVQPDGAAAARAVACVKLEK